MLERGPACVPGPNSAGTSRHAHGQKAPFLRIPGVRTNKMLGKQHRVSTSLQVEVAVKSVGITCTCLRAELFFYTARILKSWTTPKGFPETKMRTI